MPGVFGTYQFLMFQARSGVNKCDHLKLLVAWKTSPFCLSKNKQKNALDIIANFLNDETVCDLVN